MSKISDNFNTVVKACHQLLSESPEAFLVRKYLNDRISSSAQETFQFGYFPPSEQFNSLLTLVDENVLINSKLRFEITSVHGIYQKIKINTFEHHNLILPYRDVYGTIIALVGRTLDSEENMKEKNISKYKNTSFEKKSHLFGLYEAKSEIIRLDCCFLVEGQFDVISAHDAGIKNVVAVGSSSLAGEQLALCKRYTDNIYILFDNDEAGLIGAERAVKKYGNVANLISKKIPSGFKDLDELVKNDSSIDYMDLIALQTQI